jgi:dipeptidyl aminopeptidase/acylaminoacyl peptidase
VVEGTPTTGARTVAPFGSWASPIDVELVAGTTLGLSEPWLDGDDAYWLEGRPAEAGRRTLLRHGADGRTVELTPAPFRVGNRVHEYGGASYTVRGGLVVVSSLADGRLYRIDPEPVTGDHRAPVALTPEGPRRYADLRFDPLHDRLLAVRETHDRDRPDDPRLVANELVAIALDGSSGPGRVLVSGPDFVAAPRPSPDGATLAWLEWDHPDMPWDSVRLRVAPVGEDGAPGEARTIAGGPGISVGQPAWSAGGVLHAVSDETEWWNVYAWDSTDGLDGDKRNLAPMEAEIGDPAWVFGGQAYQFLPDRGLLAIARADGHDGLLRIDGGGGAVSRLETTWTEVFGLCVEGDRALAIGAGPQEGATVARLDPHTGAVTGVLDRSHPFTLDPGVLPVGEPISFATGGGATARALYFPPTNDGFEAPEGELPPLIVLSHGGPTSAATSALSLDRAFFTSRGIAVVDVDYRGSTGYGRPYRDALRGQWGIADVEDCVAAARYLVDRGDVDPKRLAIRGGSAGGYTTLAALTFQPEVFAAGISHFGIADLELIHQDGHKFESRYDEGLLAPWTEEGRKVFHDRSPIHFLDRCEAPMLLFQGLDDKVVPPSQLDAMVEAFTARGVPHVAMTFEGEGHGFRKAESRRATYRAELGFLACVFDFEPADPGIEPLDIPGF